LGLQVGLQVALQPDNVNLHPYPVRLKPDLQGPPA
jgi:hypothetical protein